MTRRWCGVAAALAVCISACGPGPDDARGAGGGGGSSVGAGAGGGGGTASAAFDNVGACQRWKQAVRCGSTPNAGVDAINCSTFTATCNLAPYFDCLSTAYVCVGGQYDYTKLSNATACTSKAACR